MTFLDPFIKQLNDMKVLRLSNFTDNCLQVSPEQAIEDLQDFLKENPSFNKVFLLAIDNKKGKFDYVWWKGRMLASEAITVLNLALQDAVQGLR